MASKRQIKKTEKAREIVNLQKQLKSQLDIVKNLDRELKDTDEAIRKTKNLIRKKKAKLEALQRQVASIESLISAAQSQTQVFKPNVSLDDMNRYSQTSRGTEENYNNAQHYVAIKRYEELVNMGIIRRGTVFDKYDTAAFLDETLSDEELKQLVEEGEKEAQRLWEKSYEGAKRHREGLLQF